MQPYITFSSLLLLVMSSVNAEEQKVLSGTVQMSGQIVESTCTIATEDFYQNILFGEHAVQSLLEKKNSQLITVRLLNCPFFTKSAAEQPTMQIAMTGETVDGSNDIFATTGTSAGVGVQFYQDGQTPYRAGEFMPARFNESGNTLDLILRLVHDERPVRYGDYYSTLKFTLDYE